MGIIRKPAAAGGYYPRLKGELKNTIKECFLDHKFGPGNDLEVGPDNESKKRTILGGVSPHAGYIYSGSATAQIFQCIFQEGCPDSIIILGTQHTGYYKIGLMTEGVWQTPLGNIEIDTELARLILEQGKTIDADDSAFNGYPHGREHNIEVQIPFIQYAADKAGKKIKIVPIKVGSMEPEQLEKIALQIAEAIKKSENKAIAIIASSDMTHYKPRNLNNPKKEIEENQKVKDNAVIEAFTENDWKKTYQKANQTSVCGPQTIATLMIVGEILGYTTMEKLIYYTSFEKMNESVPCDYSVGYFAGIITI